jgi:glutamyl-tRNA reductase
VSVVVIGLNHRTAPLDLLERMTVGDGQLPKALHDLTTRPNISEALVLSTCNRTEVYASAADVSAAEDALCDALVAHTHISEDELSCARYVLRDERAATQLFRVTSSLDSMVVGESEIQGQVRHAWEIAAEEGASGAILNQLFRQALEVGKQVRAQTRIGAGSASVSAVAVELAEEVLDDLPGRQVLLIGAGLMAESTARALVAHGVREVVFANRTVGTARELASRVGGRGVGFDRLAEELRAADIVISSTDAPHAILRRDELAPVMAARAARPMVIVDISVPRDVDPAVADIDGVALFDIDDLERVVEINLNGRRLEAERGEGFVIGAVQGFSSWRRGLAAAPAITSLHARGEEIRRAELARAEAGWDDLSDADRARLEALTKGIVNKLLHEPTVRVRAAAEDGDSLRHLESLRHLFGLEAPTGS